MPDRIDVDVGLDAETGGAVGGALILAAAAVVLLPAACHRWYYRDRPDDAVSSVSTVGAGLNLLFVSTVGAYSLSSQAVPQAVFLLWVFAAVLVAVGVTRSRTVLEPGLDGADAAQSGGARRAADGGSHTASGRGTRGATTNRRTAGAGRRESRGTTTDGRTTGTGGRSRDGERTRTGAGGTSTDRTTREERARGGPGAGGRTVGTGDDAFGRVADAARLLGVDPDADQSTIDDAYRERVKEVHPDAGGDVESFKRVKDAYETMSG